MYITYQVTADIDPKLLLCGDKIINRYSISS